MTVHIVRKFNRLGYDHLLPAGLFLGSAVSQLALLQGSLVAQEDLLHIARILSNLVFTTLVVILFLVRKPVIGRHARPLEILISLGGAATPTLLALQPLTFDKPWTLAAGNLLVIGGMLWSAVSLAALGRCFGVFPEARGLVTRGPYSWVRHPLYLGELVAMLGSLLPVLSPLSLVIYLLGAAFQILRALNEERALEATFPEYGEYRSRTARLVPGIW